MKEAFVDVNKIHDAEPIPDKPGYVRGWFKHGAQLITENGKQVCLVRFEYGEWNSFLYSVATKGQAEFSA